MADRLSLRQRFALFFAATGLGGTALIIAGLWLGHARAGGPLDGYVIAGLVGGLGVLGLSAWIGLLFDENVAKPILAVSSDLTTRARADVDLKIDLKQAKHLSTLAPAANAINAALSDARESQQRAIQAETARLEREKALFETLFRDLCEGAIVTTPDNRVMLYNRVAAELLGDIGLDRPLECYIHAEPLRHALERVQANLVRGHAGAENFLAASADGTRFLLARISPILSDEERSGYVLILRDATADLGAQADYDHLFNELLEQVRRPAASIGALLEALNEARDLPDEIRAGLRNGIRQEVNRLCTNVQSMGERQGAIRMDHWPMAQVAVDNIFDAVSARANLPLHCDRSPLFLRCDGFGIMALLAFLAKALAGAERHDLRLGAETRDGEVWLSLEWQGEPTSEGEIDGWLAAPLSRAYGDYSGRDVLKAHQTDIWSEALPDSHRIVLPLAAAPEPLPARPDPAHPDEARPEFYDFNLPDAVSGPLAERPLSDLSYVVFDTETTGLSPRGGDEIVQIAGVRIVNGRILRAESFDMLVNPGRPIPMASTKVHHISDAMVADAPDITEVGQKFHDFCAGAVLVAHNAPFDLAFLRLKEKVIGRRFDQPVLCTVLMSAALFEHSNKHTLDTLCDRFGVIIPPEARHTALGDALATAEVFVQMLRLMEGEGITTLAGAIQQEGRMSRIRKAQNY